MRLFVAVPVSDDVARHLGAAVVARGLPPGGRRVPPERYHLTLRFLGETDDPAPAAAACAEAADRVRPFDIRWAGGGAFPDAAAARVLWVGVDRGGPELAALAAAVESALVAHGHPPADRPFLPHLTVCRMDRSVSVARRFLEGPPPRAMAVDRIALVESLCDGDGVRYRAAADFPLRAAA